MEDNKKFSRGASFVVKETEEIVELVGYTIRNGHPAVDVIDEEGDPAWYYCDEVEDFFGWVLDEMDYDF